MSKKRFRDSVNVGGPNNNNSDLGHSPIDDDDGEATHVDRHVPQRVKNPNNAGGSNLPTPKEVRQNRLDVSIKVHCNNKDDPSEADTDVESNKDDPMEAADADVPQSSGANEGLSDPREVPGKRLPVIRKVHLDKDSEWQVDCEAATCTPAKSANPPALPLKMPSRSFLGSQEDAWQSDSKYRHSRPGTTSRTGASHDDPNDADLDSSESTDQHKADNNQAARYNIMCTT